MDPGPADTAEVILDHALSCPPLLGGGRMVCVDGPAGSGKSTAAQAVAEAAASRGVAVVHVLHTDDVLGGWGGLKALGPRLRNYVVGPLASGHPARYRRYDWVEGQFAEVRELAPMDLLVLEGVGSGYAGLASRRATLVWVEAGDELRLARGLARDGEDQRDHWLGWMADETRLFLTHRTRDLADVLVNEVGRLLR